MMLTFSIQRSLKEHLGTQRALRGHLNPRRALQGHSKDTWALKHLLNLDTQLQALGHSKGTWALKALGRLGTQEHKHSETRRVLGHSGTQTVGHLGIRDTLFRRNVWSH